MTQTYRVGRNVKPLQPTTAGSNLNHSHCTVNTGGPHYSTAEVAISLAEKMDGLGLVLTGLRAMTFY